MITKIKVQIKKLNKNINLPEYATSGSAGFDLAVDSFKQYWIGTQNKLATYSDHIDQTNVIDLYPNDRLLIGCGFSIALPEGYVMDVRSRSGKALKEGLIVANSPGTIDEDYRGEIGAILINHSGGMIKINKGDKIAQGVILKYEKANFEQVEKLDETTRGEGGYGSTDTLKR